MIIARIALLILMACTGVSQADDVHYDVAALSKVLHRPVETCFSSPAKDPAVALGEYKQCGVLPEVVCTYDQQCCYGGVPRTAWCCLTSKRCGALVNQCIP
jgi:hypothetical protein